MIVWLAISAAADVCIAVFLVFQLRTMQGFTKNTRKMIRRLTFAAIETGSITASWALIALAVFLATPTSNIDVGIAYVLGRLYSITLLFNLIYRKPLSVMNEGNRMQTLTVGRPSRWTTRDDSNGSDGCDAAGAKAEGDLEYQGNACGVRKFIVPQRFACNRPRDPRSDKS